MLKKMAEGDRILIQTIKSISQFESGDDGETFDRLSDFTTDYVLESASRCINAIYSANNEETPFASVKPPPSMSARYSFAAKLADLCCQLGYTGKELGYQTFMYGAETELRTVFMFLVDKLPKEELVEEENLDSKKDILRKKLGNELETQLESPWAPPHLYKSGLRPRKDGSLSREGVSESQPFSTWDVAYDDSVDLFSLLPRETRGAAIDYKTKMATLIQLNQQLKLDNDLKEATSEFRVPEIVKTKEDILPVGTSTTIKLTTKTNKETESHSEKPVVPSQGEKLEALKQNKLRAETSLLETQEIYKSARNEIIRKRQLVAAKVAEKEQLEADVQSKTEELSRKEQVLTLLPSGQENLEKLKAIVAKKKQKIVSLKQQWEAHKTDLDQECERMRALIATQQANINQRKNVMSTKERIVQVEADLKRHKLVEAKYKQQVEGLKAVAPRSVYTKQIMEILKNVSRQKEATANVIEDIKSTQKDINMLEGKLGRTYADVDYLLFEQAKKDSGLVPAYKMLTEIHNRSNLIVETVRQTGQLKRATRATNDQADAERAKKIADKVEKLKRDLSQMREENKSLKEKLAAAKS